LQKEIVEFTGLSKSVLLKITTDIKRKICVFLDSIPIMLGDPGIIVELDKSIFNFKIKAHRGCT
ncbi:hypothetical protein H311_00178, partial [Anncaliia algerae PRA109]